MRRPGSETACSQRGGVEVGRPVLETVLGARPARSAAPAHLRLVAARSSARLQRVDLALADRHLDGDLVRAARGTTDVADDERLAERERANRRRGGLAHRRPAQRDDASLAASSARARPPGRSPRGSRRSGQLELGSGAATTSRPAAAARPGTSRRRANASSELRDPLALVDVAEAADTARPRSAPGLDRRRDRPRRHRHLPDRPVVAGVAGALLDVARVDDQAGRRGRAPRGRAGSPAARVSQSGVDPAVGTACASSRPDEPRLALERRAVALDVAAGERDPGDEVVQHELVQDDDAGPARGARRRSSRARPGRCRRGTVHVGLRRAAEAAGLVRRRRRCARRAPGAAAPSSRRSPTATAAAASSRRPSSSRGRRSIVASHETRCGDARGLPPPRAAASSAFSSRKRAASASARGSVTRPVTRSVTTSSGPPASVVVTTGFSERNASYGTIPKSSSTGA